MEINLSYENDKWQSESPLKISLSRQIEDVKEFGIALERFLKWKRKELPFKMVRTEKRLYLKRWDGDKIYYREGSLLLFLEEPSRWTKYRNKLRKNKCTIVIDFEMGRKPTLEVFQIREYREYKKEFSWTLKIEQIKLFLSLLEKFAAGYWLGIHTLLKEE